MKLTVVISPEYDESLITVTAPEMTDEIRRIMDFAAGEDFQIRYCESETERNLSGHGKTRIVGSRGTDAVILAPWEVQAFFTREKAVYAFARGGEWKIRLRLCELEKLPDPDGNFIRISQSELVNLRAVEKLDLSISGTVTVFLKNGHKFYVSRRCLKAFKKAVGL